MLKFQAELHPMVGVVTPRRELKPTVGKAFRSEAVLGTWGFNPMQSLVVGFTFKKR